jgi:ABC-type glycerol-3-phosphate transport system permease component
MAGAVVVTLPMVVLFLLLQPLFLSDNALSELLDKG